MTLSPRSAVVLALVACSHRTAQDAALAASSTVVAAPPAPQVPPAPLAPAPTVDGECRADGECAPVSCCGAITPDGCTPRANAPRNCEAVECPGPTDRGGRCACRAGRCVGVR